MLRSGKLILAKANPAMAANSVCVKATAVATMAELRSALPNGVRSKTCWAWVRKLPPGRKAGGTLFMADVSFEATTNIQ